MEPTLVLKESFYVLGVLAQVDPDQPGFFDDMWMKKFMPVENLVRQFSTDQAYYGVFLHPADPQACPDYLAGMAVAGDVLDDCAALACGKLVLRQVPTARFAIYPCCFRDLGQASDFIHGKWLPTSPYEYAYPLPEFEYYPPGAATSDSPVLIYIPVRLKTPSLIPDPRPL